MSSVELTVLALAVSTASLVLGLSSLFEPRSRATVFLAWTKFISNAWAPHLALVGALGAALGAIARSPMAVVIGLAGCLVSAQYVVRVVRGGDGLARAFGADWHARLRPGAEARMLQRRWSWRVPPAPEAR